MLHTHEIRHVGHVIRDELYGTHADGYAEEHQYWNESDTVNRLRNVGGAWPFTFTGQTMHEISVRLDVKNVISFGARAIVKLMNRGSSGGIHSSTAVELLEIQRA